MLQSLVDTFCELPLVENHRFAVEIVVISVILSEIYYLIAISGYPSMSHLFVDTFFDFVMVDNFVYCARITVMLILYIYSAV